MTKKATARPPARVGSAEILAAEERRAEQGVMLRSPASEFFVPSFAGGARDLGPGCHALAELRHIVARYDAGITLRETAEGGEAQGRAARERHKAEQPAKPEPKDKLSDKWRYRELRQIEHAPGPRAHEQPRGL